MDELMIKKLTASEEWLTKAMNHSHNADPGRAQACIDHAYTLAWECGQIISEERINGIMMIGFVNGIEDRLAKADKYMMQGNEKGARELIGVANDFKNYYINKLKEGMMEPTSRDDYEELEILQVINDEILEKTEYFESRKKKIVERCY